MPESFRADIVQQDHFRFEVGFEEESWAPIIVDEPEPLGGGAGPSASRLLAAAVGNCLAASLLLCLEKSRIEVVDLSAAVEGTFERNEAGRLRIAGMSVTVRPVIADAESKKYGRCLELFEDFCIVTQSVREGIDVEVGIEPTFEAGGGESSSEAPTGETAEASAGG